MTALTEREKMARGLLYDADYDPEICALRTAAKELCYEFNALRPSETDKQYALLCRLFGKVKGRAVVNAPLWCDYGTNIEVGDCFFANHNTTILDCAKVTFGDHVFIAPNCVFSTAGHPIDTERRSAGLEFAYPITVGDNVWFGAGVIVLPGVTIGSNVVIGAGSVVTRDIPSGVVAVGNPCRVMRAITEEDKRSYMNGYRNT